MDKRLVKIIKQDHKMLVDIALNLATKDLGGSNNLLDDSNKFSK